MGSSEYEIKVNEKAGPQRDPAFFLFLNRLKSEIAAKVNERLNSQTLS